MSQKKILLLFSLLISSLIYARNMKLFERVEIVLSKDLLLKVNSTDTTFITVDVRFDIKLWQDSSNNRWSFIVLDKDKEWSYYSATLPATFNIANGFVTKTDDEKVARHVVNKIYTSLTPWILTQEDLDNLLITL